MTVPMKVHGVDISHHQGGVIGWAALKAAGVQWMYHKATEGNGFRDDLYTRRRAEAKKAGLPFGAYHFARPSAGDAREEARFFLSVAQPKPGDLIPCLDLETREKLSVAQLLIWADSFCDEVEKQTSVMPLVYTPFALSASLERKAMFWVPRYNDDNRPPVRSWDIWQFSNGVLGVPNRINGLGNVDLNHSKVHLNDLLIPTSAAPVLSRGPNIDAAMKDLKVADKRAKDKTPRDTLIKQATGLLKKLKLSKKK